MREARFILPSGGEDSPEHEACYLLLMHVIAAFGGATVTAGNGFWISEGIKHYIAEKVQVIDVAYEPSTEADHKLFDMANAYRIDGKQESVYLRYGNGHVQMVTEVSAMDNGDFDWSALFPGRDCVGEVPEAPPLGEELPPVVDHSIAEIDRAWW